MNAQEATDLIREYGPLSARSVAELYFGATTTIEVDDARDALEKAEVKGMIQSRYTAFAKRYLSHDCAALQSLLQLQDAALPELTMNAFAWSRGWEKDIAEDTMDIEMIKAEAEVRHAKEALITATKDKLPTALLAASLRLLERRVAVLRARRSQA